MWELFGDYGPVSLTTRDLMYLYNQLERNTDFHFDLGYTKLPNPELFEQQERIEIKRRLRNEITSRSQQDTTPPTPGGDEGSE
jgi:hypothetical protein